MAVLAGRTTSGERAFEKYVTKNPRFTEIDYEIEAKMDAQLLVKKGAVYLESIMLKAGTTFKIIHSASVIINRIEYAQVKVGTKVGFIPTNKIRKPTKGNGTAYEDEVVDILNAEFLEIGRPISIKVGSKTFNNLMYAVKVDSNIKRAGGVSSDPKADIIICEDIKNPFKGTPIYISHKKEGGPEAFQQYGGLSETAGKEIYNNKEVQLFLHKTATYVKNNKLEAPLMMAIHDKKLMNMSIYGPDYGKSFSLQHTQLIGQGKPVLTKRTDKEYTLTFTSHMSVSGDLSHFTGGYLPVFGATFRAGRGYTIDGKRVDGVRVAIYPQKLIASRGGLVTLTQ